jgi:hypothetical protein
MRRAIQVALFAVLLFGSAADAQQRVPAQPRKGPPVVKIAKWSLLGIAGGLGLYALQHSTRAEDAYDGLRDLCLETPARCQHGGSRYSDETAEALYRRAVSEDRQAQLGIFGGQITLFGSVGLFIYDLRDDRTPTTIPYPGRGNSTNFVLATVIF